MGNEVNERIRYYRELKKMSQETLAEAVGLNGNAYSKREREGNFKVEEIKEIARILDIDPDLIFYGEEKPTWDLTPANPTKMVFADPAKDNPFITSQEPEVVVGYKCEDMTLSVVEKQLVNLYRDLDSKKQQKFLDYINNLKENG